MENQHSLYQSSSNQLGCHQYKVNPKIKNNGGERMVQSQIHFISFIFCWFFCCLLGLFFFTVQVVLAGFSKLYVKLTVNKPDYGYWLLQSVSPLVEKTKTKNKQKEKTTNNTLLCQLSEMCRLRVWLNKFVTSLLTGGLTQTWAAGLCPQFDSCNGFQHPLDVTHTRAHAQLSGGFIPWWRQAQASGSSMTWVGTTLLGV